MKNLLKNILNLSADHGIENKDSSVILSFAIIALDTVKMESKMNFKPITEAALGSNKNFDARNCKSTLGVVGTLDAFETFAENGLVVATDNSGWKFELTDLGSTIIKLAL